MFAYVVGTDLLPLLHIVSMLLLLIINSRHFTFYFKTLETENRKKKWFVLSYYRSWFRVYLRKSDSSAWLGFIIQLTESQLEFADDG